MFKKCIYLIYLKNSNCKILQTNITVLFRNVFIPVMTTLSFQLLLQSSLSHDPSEIIQIMQI